MPNDTIPLPEPDMQVVIGGQAIKIHSIEAIHAHAAAVTADRDARIKVLEDALRRCEACTTNDAVGRQARAALGDKT